MFFRGLLAGAGDRDFLQEMVFFERFSRLREHAKWPKHWPAWVVLDLCAEGDFRRFFEARIGRKGFRSREEAPQRNNASVPRTANTGILSACGGSRKNLQVRALREMLRGPVIFGVEHSLEDERNYGLCMDALVIALSKR